MTDDRNTETANPLSEPEGPDAEESDTVEYSMTEIFRGRLFCFAHGRECYRRAPVIGEDEWVCPDERHRKPVRSS